MDIERLTTLLKEHNAVLVRRDGQLTVRAPRPLPPELMAELRQHKEELQSLIPDGQTVPPGYRLKYPGGPATDEEIAEVETTVNEVGYIILWSTVLGDLLAFVKDDSFRRMVPGGIVAYCLDELKNLFGGKRRPSAAQLRLMHEAKRHGAQILP